MSDCRWLLENLRLPDLSDGSLLSYHRLIILIDGWAGGIWLWEIARCDFSAWANKAPRSAAMTGQFQYDSSNISRNRFSRLNSRLIACSISSPLGYPISRLTRIHGYRTFCRRFSVDLSVLAITCNGMVLSRPVKPGEIGGGYGRRIRLP
jgi:hypothetical protein